MSRGNLLRNYHFQGLVDYSKMWGCSPPDYPSTDEIDKAINNISWDISRTDDIEEAHSIAGQLDKVDTEVSKEFLEYQESTLDRVDVLWDGICEAMGASEVDLESLSREELLSVIEDMRDRLEAVAPESIACNDPRNFFDEELQILNRILPGCLLYPEFSGSARYYHSVSTGGRVTWTGNSMKLEHGSFAMTISYFESSEPASVRFHKGGTVHMRMNFPDFSRLFVDWTSPTDEEANLMEMLHPELNYCLPQILKGFKVQS